MYRKYRTWLVKVTFHGERRPVIYLKDLLQPLIDGKSKRKSKGNRHRQQATTANDSYDSEDEIMTNTYRLNQMCFDRAYLKHAIYRYPYRVDIMLQIFLKEYLETTPQQNWPQSYDVLANEIMKMHGHQLDAHFKQFDYDNAAFHLGRKGYKKTEKSGMHEVENLRKVMYAWAAGEVTEDEEIDGPEGIDELLQEFEEHVAQFD